MPTIFQRFQNAAKGFLGRQSRSIAPTDLSWTRGWGMGAPFNPQQSLEAFGDSFALYRAVMAVSMEIATIDFRLRVTNAQGEYEYITDHQAIEVLKMPQPTKGGKSLLSSFHLKLITNMHLMLNGEAFWLLERRLGKGLGNGPRFIKILLPQNMYMKFDERTGELIEYTYRIGSNEQSFDPMDIVHFKLPDPLNMNRGHSPVQSIRYAIDTHKKADEMNTTKLDNFAFTGGSVETDKAVPEQERKKIVAEIRSNYSGSDKAGKIIMLPNGFKLNKTQESNADMQFIEGKKLVTDEILANYGVGPEIMGRTDSQTRANAESAIFVFMRFGVNPYAMNINDTLNNDYLVAFPNPDEAEFCYPEIVPENVEEKRLNMQAGFQVGAVTPNEWRKAFGLEPLKNPGMDETYLPLNAAPVGEPPPDFGNLDLLNTK